jgi:AraC-like DNA-binding protein
MATPPQTQMPSSAPHTSPVVCPDRYARAPRAGLPPQPGEPATTPAHERLYLPPASMPTAFVAALCRDTRHTHLCSEQRLSHAPASPLVTLSWYQGMQAGTVESVGDESRWQPWPATVMFSGSQSQPITTWAPTTGRGGMICFTADRAKTLFNLDVVAIQDRFVAAHQYTDRAWWPLFDALLAANDDAATLAALHAALQAPMARIQADTSKLDSLRQIGRHWVQRLALTAHQWQGTQSTRQVERRMKHFTGRSLREWRAMVQTEALFETAVHRHDVGEPIIWAELAAEHGFADQAHMIRATKRITGFTPAELGRRYQEDESFWLYRLWT